MSKTKTITVAHQIEDDSFVVKTATNSTEYLPGYRVARRTIEKLCAAKGWKVTFVAYSAL